MASNRNIFNVLSDDDNIRKQALGQDKNNDNGNDTHSRKRTRANDTPEKNDRGNRYVARIATEMAQNKEKIGNAVLSLKVNKIADLANSVATILSTTLVEILESNASLVSDLASELIEMDGQINTLSTENNQLKEELTGIRLVREKVEVKTACKEAGAKLDHSAKQCKLLEVNVGSCITDRKQLLDTVKKKRTGLH